MSAESTKARAVSFAGTALAAALALGACGQATETAIQPTSSATPSSSASATPRPTGPIELTTTAAAARYLDAVCAANSKQDAFDAVVKKHDMRTTKPSKQARKAARAAKAALLTEARMLADDGYVWPAVVAKDVKKVAAGVFEDAASYAKIAEGTPWVEVSWASKAASERFNEAASRVRLELGLPPRGEGCPS